MDCCLKLPISIDNANNTDNTNNTTDLSATPSNHNNPLQLVQEQLNISDDDEPIEVNLTHNDISDNPTQTPHQQAEVLNNDEPIEINVISQSNNNENVQSIKNNTSEITSTDQPSTSDSTNKNTIVVTSHQQNHLSAYQ
eukprot:GHVN01062315.1.p1 GENE.GHVN01062315.1~~GHVN01062315.1.p1  ORF type:complete len:139 (-),score=17.60 GHVN01062315.1:800-1216(-)